MFVHGWRGSELKKIIIIITIRLVKQRKKNKSCLKLKSFFFLIKEKKIVDIYAIK